MNRVLRRRIFAALCLALCMVLPTLLGGIPEIGRQLCPMHIPVLLCGFLCGRRYGLAVGAIAPLLRSVTLGAPILFPGAFTMAFELAAYGYFSGLLYARLPRSLPCLYASLLASMLLGRLVWGAVRVVLLGLGGVPFGWTMFLSAAVLDAIPGILLQILLVPALVAAIERAGTKGD